MFAKITSARDVLKTKKKAVAKELLDYHSVLKKDKRSIFGVIDQHWARNGKSRGAYHGGTWNGIDARDCMKDPEKYYGSMLKTLLSWKDPSKSDDDVIATIEDVKDLLGKWHKGFHLLRTPKRRKGMKTELRELIAEAIAKHRQVGLSVTPKAHLMEDHVVKQFWDLPFPFFYFIEEFVERNHQEGKKNDETVKRVKNADSRATAKAKRIWVARDQRVRRYIRAVAEDGKRGAYKEKKKQAIEFTPPFFPRTQPAVTAEKELPTSADRAEEEHSEQPLLEFVSTAADYSPPPQKRQKRGDLP